MKKYPASADKWLESAVEHPGSWWNDWAKWLEAHKGTLVPARKALSRCGVQKLAAAPGDYVKVRI